MDVFEILEPEWNHVAHALAAGVFPRLPKGLEGLANCGGEFSFLPRWHVLGGLRHGVLFCEATRDCPT
jgi:hypothetical protein